MKECSEEKILFPGAAIFSASFAGESGLLAHASGFSRQSRIRKLEWYAWQGSNLRPSVPETDALIQLSYRRMPEIILDSGQDSKPQFPDFGRSGRSPFLTPGNRRLLSRGGVAGREETVSGRESPGGDSERGACVGTVHAVSLTRREQIREALRWRGCAGGSPADDGEAKSR